MFDYDNLTAQEEEAEIRADFERVKEELLSLTAQIYYKYSEYQNYRAILDEVDIFGADDYFFKGNKVRVPETALKKTQPYDF